MLYFSIKAQKSRITWAFNCNIFYTLATVLSYLYDVTVAYCIIFKKKKKKTLSVSFLALCLLFLFFALSLSLSLSLSKLVATRASLDLEWSRCGRDRHGEWVSMEFTLDSNSDGVV